MSYYDEQTVVETRYTVVYRKYKRVGLSGLSVNELSYIAGMSDAKLAIQAFELLLERNPSDLYFMQIIERTHVDEIALKAWKHLSLKGFDDDSLTSAVINSNCKAVSLQALKKVGYVFNIEPFIYTVVNSKFKEVSLGAFNKVEQRLNFDALVKLLISLTNEHVVDEVFTSYTKKVQNRLHQSRYTNLKELSIIANSRLAKVRLLAEQAISELNFKM